MKTSAIEAVYRRIGDVLKHHWAGYTAYVFTGNLNAGRQIGLRPSARIPLFNGPIECRLLEFKMVAATGTPRPEPAAHTGEQAEAFVNRLKRMARHWHRWARR